MCTILLFKNLIQAIIFYTAIGIPIVIVSVIVYQRAIATRKFYKCPNCGETFRTELMDAKCCKVCGTYLENTDDEKVTDTTH